MLVFALAFGSSRSHPPCTYDQHPLEVYASVKKQSKFVFNKQLKTSDFCILGRKGRVGLSPCLVVIKHLGWRVHLIYHLCSGEG